MWPVPEISRFLGIIIAMYYNDNAPPHFHAKYGDREMKVNIETAEVIEGSLPKRASRLVSRMVGNPQGGAGGGLVARRCPQASQ